MNAALDHLDQFSIFGRSSIALFLILGLDWAFSAIHAYEEWRGEEAPLWRVFGAIVGLLVPNWVGFFFFTLVLTLSLWGGGPGRHLRLPAACWTFAAGDGRRPGGDHRSADIRHAGVTLGALCAGLPPESRSQVYATLRARSGFHCADILERPLACSGCGVDRHCGGRGCFRAGVAGDAGVQGDSALLGARALDSMAAAAGVDERVTSRLRGAYWALADTRRDAP
jgi:hypothetical protein